MRSWNGAAFIGLIVAAALILAPGSAAPAQQNPLPTGRLITSSGQSAAVGSFPANAALSPDGRYLVVTDSGAREFLTVVRVGDAKIVSQLGFNGSRESAPGKPAALYYGIAFAPDERRPELLYVSRGDEGRISMYSLDDAGQLSDTGKQIIDPHTLPGQGALHKVAGLALSSDSNLLYAANSDTGPDSGMRGSLSILDTGARRVAAEIALPGYPLAVAALTAGPASDRKVYVASERDGVVSVVDTVHYRVAHNVRTGDHPDALLLDRAQDRLYVANAGSDTVSILNTSTDRIVGTISLRPEAANLLPGLTPTGLALSPGEDRLYVSLGDMNAIAVAHLPEGRIEGYIPTGWYPTSVTVTPDGARLLVTEAKGLRARNPNGRPGGSARTASTYIQDIIEGSVSQILTPDPGTLREMTATALANAHLAEQAAALVTLPPIRHVIYIIKENRTYDQVFGDIAAGNSDPSLCLFPRRVTPNEHALADRFVLLDNFYDCAEVSADGWDWSTSGMISEYTARQVPYMYSGRGGTYDFEGENSGVAVDLKGIPDVSRAPGGYIWDLCERHGVSYRNYGFYVTVEPTRVKGKPGPNVAWGSKKALVAHTDDSFINFNLDYPDSDAWAAYGEPSPGQLKSFGRYGSASRFAEWKREFEGYVSRGDLPGFSMVRFPRDHTMGTVPNRLTPSAMVADNDYAVGELVEEVSKSPYWGSTAIFVIEDDAQDGQDHVDAHRSTCLVISPYVKRSTVDHRFYNTDSVLHTMERLLGLPPLCQYDSAAPVLDVFSGAPANNGAYQAILPDRSVGAALNSSAAYRAADSLRLDFRTADAVPDETLNDIIWHAVRGR